jgi:putative restriction endonuclease
VAYGAIPGVPINSHFTNRRSLYDAGVHRDIRRGICGGGFPGRGAESIVLSGGYEDDLDLGDLVYYTGIGKRDRDGVLTGDQEFSGLNRSLASNVDSGQPVRLIRAEGKSLSFAGLFLVEDAFLRLGRSGFMICQYRLRAFDHSDAAVQLTPSSTSPTRVLTTHYRLVRDASIPTQVKRLYDFRCQVCGVRIVTLAGPYSEGAHLVPLGGGAAGPDIVENVLSLCPNHHVMLDHGGLYFDEEWIVRDRNGERIGALEIHPNHGLRDTFATEHRRLMGLL